MRYDELSAFEILQKSLKPFCCLDIQVVGWLVKEHDIDTSKTNQLPCKGKFGFLSSGEFAHLHVHWVLIQTQSSKGCFGDARNVTATACAKCLLQFGIAFHDRLPVAFVKCRVGHLCLNGGNLFFQFLELPSFATEFFLDS